MRTVRLLVVGFLVTALMPSASAQKIRYDYQRRVDFSRLKTFAFKETVRANEASAETTLYDDPFTNERIAAAVAGQLQSRGLTRDDAHPDVYVSIRRTFDSEYLVYGPYSWWGWADGMGYQYRNYGGPWSGDEVLVGTLTIDVSDPQGDLLWRGISERRVHPLAKPAERAQRIDQEIAKLFKPFPSALPRDVAGRDARRRH